MLDSLLHRPGIIARWTSGTFGPYLHPYATDLLEKGLKPDSVRDRLRAVIAFGRWLRDRGLTAADVDERLVDRYVESSRYQRTGHLARTAVGLRAFLDLVRAKGGGARADASPGAPVDVFLAKYVAYPDQCVGLAPSTRRIHRRFARSFIDIRFGRGPG
jgi:hypothetical protein